MKILYRIAATGGQANYGVLADEDTPAATGDRISAFKPALRAEPQIESLVVGVGETLATFIQARAGQVTLGFAVSREHGTALAALQFLQAHILIFAIAQNFDLQIIIGGSSVYIPNCALTQLDPDEHSDQHTFTRYAFTGSAYTNIAP